MKIVMIYGNPIGKFYGGVSVHVKYLTSYLSNFNDLKLFILTFGNKKESYEKNGIRYCILKRMKFGKILFPIQIFYDLFRLEREVKKLNPDIIHLQSTIPLFSLFGFYMVKKYPILITLHGYFNQEYKIHTGIRKIFYRVFCVPIERFALSKIPYIIVLSPQIEKMVRKISRSKFFIISNGIDLNNIQKINSYRKNDYPTVFFLGYLFKGKGVDDLIHAIKLVKIKIDNVRLYIGGIGLYMEKLKELVHDFHLNENVTFLGLLDDNEKFAYMKSMDIFVLPSYWESFPIVLLEAMACGKPIIATNVGGNPFVVSDGVNGFLVQPGDWNNMSEKIIRLLNDNKLIDKMGSESKKRADDFNWDIIAKQTREIYGKIVNCSSEENSHTR